MGDVEVAAPPWWVAGAVVMDRSGKKGVVGIDGAGRWRVAMLGGDGQGYVLNPDPRDWVKEWEARLTPMQVRHLQYEADRVLCKLMGRYGLKEWESLKDEERAKVGQWCMPLDDKDGLVEARKRLMAAIEGGVK